MGAPADLFGSRDVLLVIFVVLYFIWNGLIRMAIGPLGYPEYDPLAVVFLIEIGKLFVSLSASVLLQLKSSRHSHSSPINDLLRYFVQQWTLLFHMLGPALIFVFGHLVFLHNLAHFDPSSYHVLLMTRILFTGLLFQFLYKKLLSLPCWISLVLLFVAGTITRSSFIESPNWDVFQPLFLGITILLAFLSSYADCYLEFIFKNESTTSLPVKNSFLFALTSAITFLFLVVSKFDVLAIFFSGFSFLTWLIVLVGIFHGLVVNAVLNFSSTLTKEFLVVFSLILHAVTLLLFHQGSSILSLTALGFIILSFAIFRKNEPSPIQQSRLL